MKNFNSDDFELRESQKLEGHTGKVLGITWKEDIGKWGFPAVIASSSDDKTIRIWEENFAGFFECKDHENEVRSVSWHVNWQLLATCGGDKSIRIWEVLPGNEFDCTLVLQGHTEDVNIVQWHGNGNGNANAVVSGSSDNTIKAWAVSSDDGGYWPCVQTLGESDRSLCRYMVELSANIHLLCGLSLSKFGERMVSCSDDLTIKIWNSEWRENTDFWSYGCTLSGYHNTAIFSVDWLRQDQGPEISASSGADDAIRVFIEDKDNEVDGLAFKLLLKKEKAHEMNVNSVKWLSGKLRSSGNF